MSYERVCKATEREEYHTKMLDSLLDHNDRHVTSLSSKSFQEAVIRVLTETKEEEKDAKRNINIITEDTLFHPPLTINTQRKDTNESNERRIASEIHAETIK